MSKRTGEQAKKRGQAFVHNWSTKTTESWRITEVQKGQRKKRKNEKTKLVTHNGQTTTITKERKSMDQLNTQNKTVIVEKSTHCELQPYTKHIPHICTEHFWCTKRLLNKLGLCTHPHTKNVPWRNYNNNNKIFLPHFKRKYNNKLVEVITSTIINADLECSMNKCS